MAANKRWSDLTAAQHRLIHVAGAAEALVTTVALGVRPARVLSFVVQPVGPLAYFAAGRR